MQKKVIFRFLGHSLALLGHGSAASGARKGDRDWATRSVFP